MLESQPIEASSIQYAEFLSRHIGPNAQEQKKMLQTLGYSDLKEFVAAVIPSEILDRSPQNAVLPKGCSEFKALEELNVIANENYTKRSLIGLGYYGTATPSLIQRQILENPSWYTAYTPYQAEISQGRLEALFNFQTLISELTGLPIANASLLDEGTAAAEAMNVSLAVCKNTNAKRFLVDKEVFPQTLAILKTRAEPLGIKIEVKDPRKFQLDQNILGILLQLPGKNGEIWNPRELIQKIHEINALAIVSIDPMAQVLLRPIGELDADIAIGSTQRLGLPMSFGGPHAAFFATKEKFKRQIPGRLVGKSIDTDGNDALRLALQTREQHIRRDKATSNICTAQVLLAVMASFYAIHHGSEGLSRIAKRIVGLRKQLEIGLKELGYKFEKKIRFDSIDIISSNASKVHKKASAAGLNLRVLPLGSDPESASGFGITLDELSDGKELNKLLKVLAETSQRPIPQIKKSKISLEENFAGIPLRIRPWLQQPVFNLYRSESELLRYMQRLVAKDFSLVHGMIPLGSCTMKLNACSELSPISWPKFSSLHPFAPGSQALGYKKLTADLVNWLGYLTGFEGISLQPNAGSQGEFAGLLVIRQWHKSRGEDHRNICLIPTSAHGTNPASSVMAGMKVVPISCDDNGNIDINDLENKAKLYSSNLAALMVTYPSTHGVFEPQIRKICHLVHLHGGQVYLDGANLNAQIGLCKPGEYGADVCHLNLHKTFCIPHGGGGPGVGPIGVAKHLVPFLPSHPLIKCSHTTGIGSISAAPWGSAGILPISWMYLRMMGVEGLRQASSIALLSANYIAKRLTPYYPVLFKGIHNLVAHECILDLRLIKRTTGVEVDDIAKRLMDYGFHAPTVSWPVAGTLMVEPTESESLQELDRFCNAMISIRKEAQDIEDGICDPINNVLKKAPHTMTTISSEDWNRPYSRQDAAFPCKEQLENKFWPAVSRINNAYGDRNLICTCSSVEELSEINTNKSTLA